MQMNYVSPAPLGDSQLALIHAAERLTALHGVAGLTIRRINEAAGVRNSSAIHYHFGSVERLLAAVLDYRMGPINRRRIRILAELTRDGRIIGMKDVVEALVRPLAEELHRRPDGNFYIRFLWRTLLDNSDPGGNLLKIDPALLVGWRTCERHVRRMLRYLPPVVLDFRLRMVQIQAIAGLASMEAKFCNDQSSVTPVHLEVEALIDGLCAMLGGPVSPEVLSQIQE